MLHYVNWGEDPNLKLNVPKTKAMYINNSDKKEEVEGYAPFNAGNRPISFVNKCYLGYILYNEMTMVPEYKFVYRRVEHKVFLLGKT